MTDISLTQLQAIALVLQLPVSRNREDLLKQIKQRLREGGASAVQRVPAKSRAERSFESVPRKMENRKRLDRTERSFESRKMDSRKRLDDRSYSREKSLNLDAYKAAIEGVADRGYTQVVGAMVNRANGKRWVLMRKPNSKRVDDRVTVWGNATGGPRKLYGGNTTMTDDEFIESKRRLGYERDAGLLRAARNLTRK